MKSKMYIMDDDIGSADLMTDFGQVLGYETQPFYKAVDLQKAVELQSPDVIVRNLKMPGKDGIEVIIWLAERECP